MGAESIYLTFFTGGTIFAFASAVYVWRCKEKGTWSGNVAEEGGDWDAVS